jgi:phosphate transport system substrate-binding protein
MIMRELWLYVAAIAALTACGEQSAPKATATKPATIAMDGSSTVFPISEAFAEEFQREKRTRVSVGVSGTGGGFKKFCRGEIDIAAASRPIKEEEADACKAAGIDFIELPLALDALAIIKNPGNSWVTCMSIEELKTAWSPDSQDKVESWKQINPKFPAETLLLFGPGSDSGTFDYFTETVNGKAKASRTDFTASEDDNTIVNGVATSKGGLGYLGIAYVMGAAGKVATVDVKAPDGKCVTPSVETARNGTYAPLSRPLFYYVSTSALNKPHVSGFLTFALNPANAKLVEEVGYVPMPAGAYPKVSARLAAKTTGTLSHEEVYALLHAK